MRRLQTVVFALAVSVAVALTGAAVSPAGPVHAKKIHKFSEVRVSQVEMTRNADGSLDASVALAHQDPRCKRFTKQATAEVQIFFRPDGPGEIPSATGLVLTGTAPGRFARHFAATETYPTSTHWGYAGLRSISTAEPPAYFTIDWAGGKVKYKKAERQYVVRCRAAPQSGGSQIGDDF